MKEPTNKVSCGSRIREGLKIRDMTQAELCKLTGIPKSAMSQYCRGSFVPKQDRTEAISNALNVSEAWLMGFPVPMERKAPASPEESRRSAEFAELFGRLTAEEQSLVISQIKGILANRES